MKIVFSGVALAALLATATPSHAQSTAPTPAPGGAVQPVTVHAVAHFDFDRTTVLPADQQALLSEVATMQNVTWKKVTTEGHTDSVGSAAYNQRLSQRRAGAVRAYLLSKGLDPTMVRAAGVGAKDPVADNASAEGRAKNRRTEVTFEGVRAATAP
jgi:OOP family OmpA-OmpF porin